MAVVKKRSTLAIWKDVIFAIFLREIKSKFNDRIGISWAVIQPVAFIFALSFLRGRFDGGDTHTMPPFVFILYGMVCIQFFLSTLSTTASAIKRNRQLFAFRQVQPISSVIALALFEYLVKVFVVLVIVVIMYFLEIDVYVYDPLTVLYIFTVVWLIAISIGLLFALGRSFIEEVDKIRELAQRPLFFISGVFFSLQDLSRDSWKYFDWNPVLHAIELSRQAAYPSFNAEGVSLFYLNSVALISVFLALASYIAFWKQAISR